MNSASSWPVSSNAETSASQTSTRPFSLSRDFFHSLTGRLPRNRGRFLPTPRMVSLPAPLGCITSSMKIERLSALPERSTLITISACSSAARASAAW